MVGRRPLAREASRRQIEVKLEPFASAVPAMAPLASGEIQVVGGGIGPPLFNAYARAFPVRVVGHRTRNVMPARRRSIFIALP